ncbi:MAG: 50S ribosomal protein L3 N(5)-glutamine methyltransferase [Gammaproteobacteria bacterium]|nr:50S ribosomal protein L3 N(5)-glutamine methyltransferase [Gammaproteobacteria bacterium]
MGEFFRVGISTLATKKVFLGHGTDDLKDEAWWLIAGALHLPLDLPPQLLLNARVTPAEHHHLVNLLYQRGVQKIPTAYLLKQAYQGGQQFYVDERVLIPRSPIAELIEKHFEPWLLHPESVTHILDLCTGSGCLAILSALAFPAAHVDALDISRAALAVAHHNVDDYELNERVRILESDVFSALKDEKYDLIISNPPYVDLKDLKAMPDEFHHEPTLALAAGDDGLDIVREILEKAKLHLQPEGLLIVEVGNSQPALEAAFPNLPFVWLDFERGGEGVFLLKAEDL